MKLKDKVRAVLDSDLSQYLISKRTGVSQGSLSSLRNGTRKIGNLTIDTAQKLADLYDEEWNDVQSN